MSDKNIRVKIEAISELPDVAAQMAELIRLTKQQQEITQQSANQAAYARQDQVKAIQGVTDAIKDQQTQQRKSSDDSTDGLKKVGAQYDELGKSVRSFTTLVAAAFTLNEIKSFGMDVIDAKTKIDSLKISLDVMLGSKRESAELYSQIVTLAKQTPFSLEEVAENVVKLKAYNIATKDLIPTVEALGNMAAAVGKEKLPQITLAYGQVINMGKLMGTETRQFIEAGIPLYDLLAESMKKPKEEVIKLAAEHKIMAEDVKKAIMDASEVGGKYYNLMALQSKTLGGEVSNLGDTFFTAKARVGDFFEGPIKSGIRALSEFMTATIGSNSAIERTKDIVIVAGTAFATLTIATKAQNAADIILNGLVAVKNVLYGEYLLAMRATTAQQIVFTAAETEAVVAAEAFNLAISSNPIGLIVTLIGTAVTAFYAYKAINDEVTTTIGEQQIAIKAEQTELRGLVDVAMQAAQGSKERKDAIALLIEKYPQYFSGLNTEKTSNSQLKEILDEVNGSYMTRISLARQAYKVESLQSDLKKNLQAEAEILAEFPKDLQAKYGGDINKAVGDLFANPALFDRLKTDWLGETNFSMTQAKLIGDNITRITSDLSKTQQDAQKSGNVSRAAEIEAIKAHYAVLREQADGNSKAIEKINADEKTALAKTTGTYHEATVKAAVDHAEKLKSVTLLSAKEIAVIKADGDAEAEVDRGKQLKAQLDFLNKQEDVEIAAVNKIKVAKDISNKALAALTEDGRQKIIAIEAKYDLQRATVLEQIEQETQRNFLLKVQESNDKIALLTAKRLEAEKMLTMLNDASTNDERLAAIKVYQQKYKDSLNTAAVEELKIQTDTSRKVLDDIIATDGEKGDAYRKAYAAWLKDNEQYNTALTKQTIDSVASTAKQIQQYEKEIQDARKETAKIEKDTLEKSNQTRAQMLDGIAKLISVEGGLFGQVATGMVDIYNGIDKLQLKTLSSAKTAVKSAEDSLAGIKMIFSDGSAEGDAAIAKGTQQLAQANGKLAEAQGVTTGAALAIVQVAAQIVQTVNSAQIQAEADKYLAIATGLAKAREAYKFFYDFILQAGKDAHKEEMDNFKGNLEEKLTRIKDYYAQEKEITNTKDRVDQQLALYQAEAEIRANSFTDAKAALEGIKKLQEDKLQWTYDNAVAEANALKAQAKEIYDTKLQYLDAELTAYKEAKNAEMEADREAADVAKTAAADARDADIAASDAHYNKLKEKLDGFMTSAKETYQKDVDAVQKAYNTQVELMRTKEANDRAEIQATYDLKKSLLDQATSDEIEEIAILERPRLDALNRYEDGERARIIATRNRILATLTDEGERATVTAEYERQLGELHQTVEDAKLDKSKGISLATKQLNLEQKNDTTRLKEEETTALTNLTNSYQTLFKNMADERDKKLEDLKTAELAREESIKADLKTLETTHTAEITKIKDDYTAHITKIETDLKTEINALKDQILQKENETTQEKKRLNFEYKQEVLLANAQIFEAQRALLIAQLNAQIAVLNSQKSWTGIGNGKINDAINTIQDSINQIGGIVFNTTPDVAKYLDAYGFNSFGNPKTPITTDGSYGGTVPANVYTANGDEIVLTYKEDLTPHTVYDALGNPIQIAQASGNRKDNGLFLFYQGSDYVDGLGYPDGRDTVPARINKGERILPTADNLEIGGRNLTNEQLVNKIKFYDKLAADFPQMVMPGGMDRLPLMQLPAHIMNSTGGTTIDFSGLQGSMERVERAMKNLNQLHVNMDEAGFTKSITRAQSKSTYVSNLMQQ